MTNSSRRQLDFRSADEVLEDIEHLRTVGYSKLKNWNLTQICEHLHETTKGGMDGFGFRLPWILRATIVKWVFRFALKRRKLLSGAPTFNSLLPKSQEEDPQLIERCIQTTRRAGEFQGSMEGYALLDNLSTEDWKQFMWLHASHHLSFLIPNDSEQGSL
ncbi:MAG: DUF1569 domain-containing protein [Pirellulaceae bacterium]